MLSRRRRAVLIGLAPLAALLASILSPRAGLIVHSHSGGDHAHVHLGEMREALHHHHYHDAVDHHHQGGGHHHGTDDEHLGYAQAHHHDVAHHDHDDRANEHRSAGTPGAEGKPALVDSGVHRAGVHWHGQHPYLLYLPSVISTPADLPSRHQYRARQPATPVAAPLALPFARGPPSVGALPTTRIS